MEDSSLDPKTAALAGRARGGDADALASLYERVAPAVHAWAKLRTRGPLASWCDPDDVVQEVFSRALARIDSYDPANSRFRAWVFRIANLVLMEAYRKVPAAPSAPAIDEVPDSITSLSRRLSREEGLRRFVDQAAALGEDDLRLLLFKGLEGLDHDEASSRLGIDVATCRKRWQRLRARLEPHIDLVIES